MDGAFGERLARTDGDEPRERLLLDRGVAPERQALDRAAPQALFGHRGDGRQQERKGKDERLPQRNLCRIFTSAE